MSSSKRSRSEDEDTVISPKQKKVSPSSFEAAENSSTHRSATFKAYLTALNTQFARYLHLPLRLHA